jgi:glycosyltransferase involved in cell wall biosynthesis
VIVSPPSKDFAGSNERFAASKKSLLAKAYAAPEACTLAVSEAVADDACEYYSLDRNKIKIARSPVDITEIQRLANAFQAFPNTQSNIVVVGRLSSEKGQGRAIEAFANQCTPNRSSRLHIVGDGPDRKKLQQLSDELQPTVQFHGHQANPYPFIAQADVVVIPSIYEGLPNIALEAMALGTPVIATKCSKSVEQLFAQRRGILVEPDSAAAIRSGLDQFFTLPQDKVQCIANSAKAYVAEHHAMDQWIDQMQAIFSEQIAAHRVKVRK